MIRDAGGLTYKSIESEFKAIAATLGWPKKATLKDFRHLTNTLLMNAGMSQEERQYLMGQSQGRSAIVHYAHVNCLGDHYRTAVEREFGPILKALAETPPTAPS